MFVFQQQTKPNKTNQIQTKQSNRTQTKSIRCKQNQSNVNKKGEKLFAPMENETIEVEITDPVFIDPNNKRLGG